MKNLTGIAEEQRSEFQEGISDGRKLRGQEGKLFNNSSIDEISQQPLTETNHSTVQPFNHSTDNGYTSIYPYLYTSKKAFTLAEVLIALAVVGVVAAMTIPTLINKHREQVTVAKVKKFYSTMSNAYLLSVKDNGYANEWNVDKELNSTTANQIAGYLKPYLKIIKDCGTNSGCLNYKDNSIKYLNGNTYTGNYDTYNWVYKIILSDGSYVWWQRVEPSSDWCTTSNNRCVYLYTDINGGKAPNTIGKDIFQFYIKAGGVTPSIINCSIKTEGWGCSGYIIKNGNMNYLH